MRTKKTPKVAIPGQAAGKNNWNDGSHLFSVDHGVTISKGELAINASLRTEVILVDRSEWMDMPQSRQREWATTLIGCNLIGAVRVVDIFDDRAKVLGRTGPEPLENKALRSLRNRLFDFLEDQPDITWVEIHAGGNGSCRAKVTMDVGLEDEDIDIFLDLSCREF